MRKTGYGELAASLIGAAWAVPGDKASAAAASAAPGTA
jgi:hypothetical protein